MNSNESAKGTGGVLLPVRLAFVGDYDPSIPAHQAIPLALKLAESLLGRRLEADWVPTDEISPHRLEPYDGIWVVPGSPYQSEVGALMAIRFARESQRPFLGTCGGFQHALLEMASSLAGVDDPAHAETRPEAAVRVIEQLACSLVEVSDRIDLEPHSRLAQIMGATTIQEEYRCRYGLNENYRKALEAVGVGFVGVDRAGAVRAFELAGHPFFVGTLFQPERHALHGVLHPLIEQWFRAAAADQMSRSMNDR